jgi:hypothetical protein
MNEESVVTVEYPLTLYNVDGKLLRFRSYTPPAGGKPYLRIAFGPELCDTFGLDVEQYLTVGVTSHWIDRIIKNFDGDCIGSIKKAVEGEGYKTWRAKTEEKHGHDSTYLRCDCLNIDYLPIWDELTPATDIILLDPETFIFRFLIPTMR